MHKNYLYKRIIGFKDHLLKIKTYEYYAPVSYVAIDNFIKFSDYIINHFDEIETSSHIEIYRFFIIKLIPYIRYIQSSSTEDIPWSMIPNLDRVLKNELGEKYFILFRPRWHFNYSMSPLDILEYLTVILNAIFPSNQEEIKNLFDTDKIHIFMFPYLEKTNILLHSIVGHEIGHFFQIKWNENEGEKLWPIYQNQLIKYYDSIPHDTNDLFYSYQKTEIGLNVLKGMYREILSDIVGYYIFGPSIIFSMYYILNMETKLDLPSSNNEYYPITKYRLRILFERYLKKDKEVKNLLEANNSNCSNYLKLFTKEIETLLNDKKDITLMTEHYPEENKIFQNSLADLDEYIKSSIKNKYFSTEYSSKLFDKLECKIPINEIKNSPVNMCNILFVGWIYYYKIFTKYEKDEFFLNLKRLIRLLLKSLSATSLHQQYIENLNKK